MTRFFYLFLGLAASTAAAANPAAPAANGNPDFVRDIYPIFQKSCFECHGAEKQKAKLRLDVREAAFKGGENGSPIVKGKPDESELLRRISLPKSDEEVMPNRGELLSKADVEKVRAWIAAGAPWPDGVKPAKHWAYVPPVKAPVPALPEAGKNPVDAFILARLKREKVKPLPDAELPIIARRLYLDIIGLPPKPEDVDAFTRAAKTGGTQAAVDQLADKLLASPQYGEKWARPWLDAARYADSHGFQRDDLHEVWPYRDWVIRALNTDMPFDKFTIEQLAGDLLPYATEQQRIATGFNRGAPCNVEAGTDPEENRVNQVMDRVNTLGAVWLGSTIECAQCHDHKYDPITARDYYGLFAFFNNTEIEAERKDPKVLASIRFLGPYMTINDPANQAERTRLGNEIAAVKALIVRNGGVPPVRRADAENDNAPVKRPAKLAKAPTGAQQEQVLTPVDFDSAGGANHEVLADGSTLLRADPPETDTYTVTVNTSLKNIIGFKVEALTDPSLPGTGPGRGDPDRTNFVLNTFAVSAAPAKKEQESKDVQLTDARADFSQVNWHVSGAIDGDPKTGWAIAPEFHKPHWATFRAVQPVGFDGGTVLKFKLVQEFGNGRTIGRLRISALTGGYTPPESAKNNPEVKRLITQLSELENALDVLGQPRTLVMKELPKARPAALFVRGDFRNPGPAVTPSTPAVLPALHEEGTPDRLALARWIVSRENPLVARVVVNRLWSEIFGIGIVTTPEDFGVRGERPTHPELLDWLAVEFMETGWSQKQLLRLIVTSSTYRRSSRETPESLERDPRNLLLARGSRFRLSAEGIRDNALAVSGLLNLKQFGPPIRPPQPAGLWDKQGGQKYDYIVSPGDEQYRRGIYVVLKRTAPYPSFINFDSTARLACRVKRDRSNTPLQALTLLNDPVYVEAARALAGRIVREVPSSDVNARLRRGFTLAMARPPKDNELSILRKLYDTELDATQGKQDEVWFSVASALLNLDETITKN